MSDEHHVYFGPHRLPVYEQAPMRIIKRIGRLRDAFAGAVDDVGEFDPSKFFSGLGGNVYYVFETFITNLPERMPEYEFWGYSSRDAYDAGDFDPERDGEKAATFTQWLDAFDVIVQVHGGKRFLDLLGNVVPLEIVRAELGLALSEWRESLPIGSPSLPSTRDGSEAPTTSGTTGPESAEPATGEESASESPMPTSSGSRQPISA